MSRILLAFMMYFSAASFAAEPPGPTPDQTTKDAMEKINTGDGKVENEHNVRPGTTDEGKHVHDKKMKTRRKKEATKKAQKDLTP